MRKENYKAEMCSLQSTPHPVQSGGLGLLLVSFPKEFKSWQSQASICCSLNNGDEVMPISFSITTFAAGDSFCCPTLGIRTMLNELMANNLS